MSSPAFRYASSPHVRRHGPDGYVDYASFRPWLRDEFSFRCVYCLLREQWGRVTGEFDLDHFEPQSIEPDAELEFDNLLYACHGCNLRKGSRAVPDPSVELTAESIRLYPDGSIVGLTDDADRLIRVLCLNSPRYRQWRQMWMRIVELAEEHEPSLFRQLMGYPDELPDLQRCNAPANSRSEGIASSAFERRERGELPDTYLE